MPYSDISSRVTISGYASGSNFPTLVHQALTTIYEHSTLAATAIRDWLDANPTKNLEIKFVAGAAQALPNGGLIEIDPLYFTSTYYITSTGHAAADTFLSGLTHELGHAVTGDLDDDSFANLAGNNIVTVNDWFAELGIEEQASYNAYFTAPSFVTVGKEYSAGNRITNAIIDRGLYSNNGFSFDTANVDLTANNVAGDTLIIGSFLDNTYTGTSSRDWIYGGAGNDTLKGGGGSDFLYGEHENDEVWGGAGDDQIHGGEGNDLLLSGTGSDFVDGGGGTDRIDLQLEILAGGATFSVRGVEPAAGDPRPRFEMIDPTGVDTVVDLEFVDFTSESDTLTLLGNLSLLGEAGLTVDLRGAAIAFGHDIVDASGTDRGVQINLGTGSVRALDQDTDVGYWGWVGERIASWFLPDDLRVINGNQAVGTQYSDYLVASAGAQGSGEGYSALYGGGGNDLLVGGGWESHLSGGQGEDQFAIGTNTWIEDAEVHDSVTMYGIPLFGGVKQWWMEGNTAYWAPFSSVMGAFPVIGSSILTAAAFFIDAVTMKFVRFQRDAEGNLLVGSFVALRPFCASAVLVAFLVSGCGEVGKPKGSRSDSPRGAGEIAPAPSAAVERQDGIRVGTDTMISVETRFDPTVARTLGISERDQAAYSHRVLDVLVPALREAPVPPKSFEPGGTIPNDGHNIVVTQTLEQNSAGAPYRLVLTAHQGARMWRRSIERGVGRERPEVQGLPAGEEGPLMNLNQRLAASIPLDARDLARQLLDHLRDGAVE